MASQATDIKPDPDAIDLGYQEIKLEVEALSDEETPAEPFEPAPVNAVEAPAGPSESAQVNAKKPQPRPQLMPIKAKLCVKKTDIRQCRLCLRVLPREDVRETTTPGSDIRIRRKIKEAVAVSITSKDKVKTVCTNCLLLVDMVWEFRMACRKADTLHTTKLLMMHPGGWMSEETKTAIETCHKMVKRNGAEMDGLYSCSNNGEESTKGQDNEDENTVAMDSEGDAPSVQQEKISDMRGKGSNSDPEMSEEIEQEVDQQNQNVTMDVEASPIAKGPAFRWFRCDICGSLVMNSSEEHHKNKHLGVRPYWCDVVGCESTFYSQQSKQMHAKKHAVKALKVTNEETWFICKVCHQKIKGKVALQSHMNVQHTANSVYAHQKQCTICWKYYHRAYIRDHMATHTGEQLHECDSCNRKFILYNNLWFHKRTCNGKKLGIK